MRLEMRQIDAPRLQRNRDRCRRHVDGVAKREDVLHACGLRVCCERGLEEPCICGGIDEAYSGRGPPATEESLEGFPGHVTSEDIRATLERRFAPW